MRNVEKDGFIAHRIQIGQCRHTLGLIDGKRIALFGWFGNGKKTSPPANHSSHWLEQGKFPANSPASFRVFATLLRMSSSNTPGYKRRIKGKSRCPSGQAMMGTYNQLTT
jgi:hypothetical protein